MLALLIHVLLHALIDIGVFAFFFFAFGQIFRAFQVHKEYLFFLSYLRTGKIVEDHKSFMDEYFKFKLKQQQFLEYYRGCEHCPNLICPQREKWIKLKKGL